MCPSASSFAVEKAAEAGATFRISGRVEIAVVIVTYDNAADIEALLGDLREAAAEGLRIRVIVADNASRDGTLDVVRGQRDVIALSTGGNLGYAGGINAARAQVGAAEAILVLNPDLRVRAGAVRALLARLRARPSVGAVVPLLLDADGTVYRSLRREPTLRRAVADALLGRWWPTRPAALSEYVRNDTPYGRPHDIEWATGAALMIRTAAADEVGAWDERFFLYSEETDYQRRLREAGWEIWFEPQAVMCHRGGGSGVSPDLVALTIVNRVRYAQKHRPRTAWLFLAAVLVGEHLRRDPSHRRARWALRARHRWDALPSARQSPPDPPQYPRASVIVPAHDEAATIARTLAPLGELAALGRLDVVVVCNGCTDDTAARARAFAGVRVVEVPTPSKSFALRVGDTYATRWPRVYLDADIVAPTAALAPVIAALGPGGKLAARPAFRVVAEESSWPVRAYYRARSRMPSTSGALWGAGVYALSEAGHARLGTFPDVTADDLYVDRLFGAQEKHIGRSEPVEVRPPRDSASLIGILARARRGPSEQGVDTGSSTARELAATVRGPVSAVDAAVYAAFALRARRSAKRGAASGGWERDETSRRPARAQGPATRLDHVLVTRFNLPTPGPESWVRARPDWLRQRIALFERFTIPSVRQQTVDRFHWIVYADPESPAWLRERLDRHRRSGLLTPLYRESVTWRDLGADAREASGARGEVLLTTNLDNDDAIAADFVERIQALARQHAPAAIFLDHGLILSEDALFARRDRENAFCSVAEPWTQTPATAWRDWHTLLHEHFPVVTGNGGPAWLQVVHEGNVSNRVRGVRVSPRGSRAAFPRLLEDLDEPSVLALVSDRIVRAPARTLRDAARSLAKWAVLRIAGKEGLDRAKSRRRAP